MRNRAEDWEGQLAFARFRVDPFFKTGQAGNTVRAATLGLPAQGYMTRYGQRRIYRARPGFHLILHIPNPNVLRAACSGGGIPRAPRSFPSENSYSPSMLIRAHGAGERPPIAPGRFSRISAPDALSKRRARWRWFRRTMPFPFSRSRARAAC